MDSISESTIDQSRLQRYLGYRLTRTEIHIHKLFAQRVAGFDLKPSEFSILVLLDSNPGIYLRQLGEALDISPSNLVPVVERLVQRGLIQRQPDPRDRRLQQLHLTPEGRALQGLAEGEVARLEDELEQLLSPAERAHLLVALDKLTAVPPGQ
ncbi:MarR family winged helix-turn-helix transcriptional regulator [Delftia sp. PS-11]|uniref:MarR family winged helix-turn-helix transcriptional regulator n=1 Tax=Delftia sp. PS-11 TaxID=2767222 RepID=UPI00245409B1|nr:MarR family transcriptional regulator [Delftia sp. PS-11]KAJ8745564.1 MarR family transcriptional regulator [Delftia sp. PS-11]